VLKLESELPQNNPFPYPNPHSNYIYFNNIWDHKAEIYLHNQLGQLIYEGEIEGNQELKINNSGPSGIYILSAKFKNNTLRYKLNKI
jgi:nitrous oxidase accessory protein NosD